MSRLAMAVCCLGAFALPSAALAQSTDDLPSTAVTEPAQGEPETDPSEEYDRHFQDGKQKYINQDFVGAILSFQSAYEIRQEPKLLYNIGRIYERMSKLEPAIEHYDRFIHSPDVDIELRRDAMSRLKTLREIVAMDSQKKEEEAAQVSTAEVEVAQPSVRYEPDYTAAWVTIPSGVAATALIGGGFHLMANSEASSANEPGMEMMRETHLANADKYQLVSYIGYGLGSAITLLGVYFALDPAMEPVNVVSSGEGDDGVTARMTAGPSANGSGFSIGFDMSF